MIIEGFKNNFDVFSSSPGLFDECLLVESPYSFQGQYCSAFFKELSISDSDDRSKLVVARESDGPMHRLPRIGFCISSSCSPSYFRSSVSQWITRNALKTNQTSLIVTINDDTATALRRKWIQLPNGMVLQLQFCNKPKFHYFFKVL